MSIVSVYSSIYKSQYKSQIFIRFAVRSTIFKVLHILGFSPLTPMLFFYFWQIAKKVIAYISPWLWYFMKFGWNLTKTDHQKSNRLILAPDYDTLYEVWLKYDENCWMSSLSKMIESENLQSAPNDPSPYQPQGTGHQKYPTYVHCSIPSPKVSSVSLYDQPFSRYSTF